MRVLLVGPDYEENLSLRYLASSLRAAGHEPAIVAFDTAADTHAVLAAAAQADLVGLSMCYQVRAGEYLALARELKQRLPRLRVIAGGHYASCAAEALLDHHPELDLIAVHEAERTLAELASLRSWSADELAAVPGIVYRGQGKLQQTRPRTALADLDSLPWPDRTGPARLMAGVPTAYMMGSRGCLSACDYCCISTMHRMVSGKRFRQRSPQDIADEMASLYHERGVRQFIFHDDNFLVPQVERNLERIETLDRAMRLHRMRRVALALKCRPADVNREVFLRLREMGLLRVFLGIESGSSAGLASIGRSQTIEDEHRALTLCEDLGISTQYTIIMFHPEATLASMREDLAFVKAHSAHPMSYCRAEIYTGTPLEQRMIRLSRAYGNYLAREYSFTDPLTRHAWNTAWRLLSRRCFAPDHLLGQIVRLDHQAAVLQHFYEGREVDKLVADFAAFEVEINRETVTVIDDVFSLCEAHPDPASPAFRAGYAALGEREEARCDVLLRRACAFREDIESRSLGVMGLAGRGRAALDRTFIERLPRHAAAVFLAVGLLNCESKTSIDAGHNDGSLADGKPVADSPNYKDQRGMFEAPPPRLDAPLVQKNDAQVDTPSVDGGASGVDGSDSRAGQDLPDFKDQGGMFEAPPPRLDAPLARLDALYFRDQGGANEAPPPPMDASITKRD